MSSSWITMPFMACFELPLFPYYMYFIFDDIDVSCKENAWTLFGSYVPMSSFVLGCVHVLDNPFWLCIWYFTQIDLS